MHRNQAGDAAAFHIFAANGMPWSLGRDHDDVKISARLDQPEMDVQAVRKRQRCPLFQGRVQIVGVNRCLMFVGRKDHDNVCPRRRVGVFHHAETGIYCFRGCCGSVAKRDCHFGNA